MNLNQTPNFSANLMSKNKPLRFKGEVHFDAPIENVWNFVTNPEKASSCVPGLIRWQEIEVNKKYALLLAWISKTVIEIPTTLEWQSRMPPNELVFSATANASSMGVFELNGHFSLSTTAENETNLLFTAVIQTPNTFSYQLIKNILPKQTELFFRCLKSKI